MRPQRFDRARPASLIAAVLLAATWSCADVTDVDVLQIDGSGVLFGQVFLDQDGDRLPSAGDSPFVGAGIVLVTSGTLEQVDQATTDSMGIFRIPDVPVGSYRLQIDSATLGDSLSTLFANQPVTLARDDTTRYDLGATYAFLTVEEVLVGPVGRRVFTSGIAVNARQNFGDGQVHFRGDSAFLRGLSVDRGGLNPGDSARLLGRIVMDNGRPALRAVTYTILVPSAQIVTPIDATTAEAATADGGLLDAALVRISDAEITDTSTVAGWFRFWADDGTDSVEFVIKDFIVAGLDKTQFRPDTTIRVRRATGLLSPIDDAGTSPVRWRFLLRSATDFQLEVKQADIAITTAFDTASASLGDTVQVMVTASNAGPLTATSLQVSDTIPTGASFVSATTTAGSYDDATGVWDLGSFAPGAADTLRIDLEITIAAPALVTNIARSLGLITEADPVQGNNSASASLPIT